MRGSYLRLPRGDVRTHDASKDAAPKRIVDVSEGNKAFLSVG